VPSNLIPIAALTQRVENEYWHDGESNPKILQHSATFFPAFRPRRCSENRA